MVLSATISREVTEGTLRRDRGPRACAAARLMAMTSTARPVPAVDSLPLVQVLEALEAWRREPDEANRAAIGAALETIVVVTRARGVVLDIAAPPLPYLNISAGSLAGAPPGTARQTHPTFPIGSRDGDEPLGRLVVDAPAEAIESLVRVLDLAVDAAWSRAAAHDRAERLAALEAATRTVAAELDIDRVLQLIVDLARTLLGAQYAALGTIDARRRIDRFITSGMTPEVRAAIGDPPRGHGLLGAIPRDGRTMRADRIGDHRDSFGFPANHPPMTTFLGAPVSVKGRPIGSLYLTDKAGGLPFSEDDARLVEMFAIHAGIAIENARLHDQVQRMAVIEERERIGKDLHDGIIQSIYAVGLSLEDVAELVEDDDGRIDAIARVDRAIDSLNLVISDIRTYIMRLRPTLADEEDPVEALARLVEEFGIHAVIDLEVDITSGADALRGLAANRRSDLLFIAREALSNIARHSGATQAAVALAETDGQLALVIDDNGRGFDPEAMSGPDAFGRHQGLTNMRDRAVGMGGTFVVERPDGPGTRIIVRVPAASGTRPETDASTGPEKT